MRRVVALHTNHVPTPDDQLEDTVGTLEDLDKRAEGPRMSEQCGCLQPGSLVSIRLRPPVKSLVKPIDDL
jgi:hypothetical protein